MDSDKILISGNQAIARGAVEAGVNVVTSYPGTPSTDIFEAFSKEPNHEKEIEDIYQENSINEKVAFELSLGASLVNKRSMTIMKNAGFNLIMDTITAVSYTGIMGGLVIAVADDPGAHFSVTEQDNRSTAKLLRLPCLEPSNAEECLNMTKEAFNLSEKFELPVIVRTVTRIAHTLEPVKINEVVDVNKRKIQFNKHHKRPYRWNSYAPPRPVEDHKWLCEKQKDLIEESEKSSFNIVVNEDKIKDNKTGVICSGIAFKYVSEYYDGPIFKVGFVFPLPDKEVIKFIQNFDKIIVMEDGASVIEDQLRIVKEKNNLKVEINSREIKYGELNTKITKDTLLL